MNYQQLDTMIDEGLHAVKKYKFQVVCFMATQRGLKAYKRDICDYMVKVNPGARKESGDLITYRHYMNCPVWRALGVTDKIIHLDKSSGLVTLNVELTLDQREKIVKKCKGIYRN